MWSLEKFRVRKRIFNLDSYEFEVNLNFEGKLDQMILRQFVDLQIIILVSNCRSSRNLLCMFEVVIQFCRQNRFIF